MRNTITKNKKEIFWTSDFIFDMGLPANAIAVYCCLMRFANKQTYSCFPSNKTLQKKCHLSKNTVIKCLRLLEEKGLIEKISRKRLNNSNSSNMYYLFQPEPLSEK